MRREKETETVSVAVNVAVKRYYRLYAKVVIELQDGCIVLTPDDEKRIKDQIITKILEDQDRELSTGLDPDMDVEREDIEVIDIDHDAIFFE